MQRSVSVRMEEVWMIEIGIRDVDTGQQTGEDGAYHVIVPHGVAASNLNPSAVEIKQFFTHG